MYESFLSVVYRPTPTEVCNLLAVHGIRVGEVSTWSEGARADRSYPSRRVQ